jgi:hypothetical protein
MFFGAGSIVTGFRFVALAIDVPHFLCKAKTLFYMK